VSDHTRSQQILDSLEDRILVLEPDGTITMMNLAWRQFAHTSENQEIRAIGIGTNYLAFYRQAAASGDPMAQAVLDGLQQVLSGTRPNFSIEYSYPTTQALQWFILRALPLVANRGRIVLSHLDITAHKQAEARLLLQSVALEAAANAIMITDDAGIIQWVNPAFTQLTGYNLAEVVGRDTRLLKSGKQAPSFYTELWNTITDGNVWHGELINRHRDGHLYVEEQTITPVRDANGRVMSFIAIKQDITARKRRERQQHAIMTISSALRAASTQIDMLPIIANTAKTLLDTQAVLLALPEPDMLELRVALGLGSWSTLTGQRRSIQEHPIAAIIHATDHPYIGPNPWRTTNGLFPDMQEAPLILMGLPIRMMDRPSGILIVGRQQPFDDIEVGILTAIADIAANAMHRAMSHEQTLQHLHRIRALHRIDQVITSSAAIEVTLQIILNEIAAQLGAEAADALVVSESLQTLTCLAIHGQPPRQLGDTMQLGEGHAGQATLQRQMIAVTDLRELALHEKHTRIVSPLRFCYAVPLIAKGLVKGVLELYYRDDTQLSIDWQSTLEMFANQAAIAIDNADLFENLQRSNTKLRRAYDTTIEGWSRALDLRDKETEGHTLRVTEMTLRLATAMDVPSDELVHIRRGALLHDIGKMGVPDHILLKPGPLTDEEWLIMRQHPTYAYEMLAPIDFLKPALDIPYCHHEQWNGSGYPRGLHGEQIPLAARIFAVIDVWDALISDRPYRSGWPIERVMRHISNGAGSSFDTQVVTIFLHLLGHAARP